MTAKVLNVWWDGRIVGQFTQAGTAISGFLTLRLGLMTQKHFRFQPQGVGLPLLRRRLNELSGTISSATVAVSDQLGGSSTDQRMLLDIAELIRGRAQTAHLTMRN